MLAVANPAVNLIGVGLVVLGVALLVATLAFWRAAIEDPEVLAPLEVMGERRYGRANDFERFEILNDVRPGGPMPIRITSAPPPQPDETSPQRGRAGARRGQGQPDPQQVDIDVADQPGVAPPARRGSRRGKRVTAVEEGWDDAIGEEADGDETGAVVPPVIDPLLNLHNKRTRD